MGLSNFEKWREVMRNCPAPDNFIDFAFYSLITSSLQRRVWVGPEHKKLYPNIYSVLVGDPGVGKGIVIKPVREILEFHKMINPAEYTTSVAPTVPKELSKAEELAATSIAEEDYEQAQKLQDSMEQHGKKKLFEKPLAIPIAADATTYEALVKELAVSLRRMSYNNGGILQNYLHSSLCFCLEEISSLFRKRTEDLVHFMIQAYDCGDYTYKTKSQGNDKVKNCCLNILGGTTPAFLHESFSDSLITEGFASRTFFLYSAANRFRSMLEPELDETQKQFKKDIIEHIGRNLRLFGKVEYESDVMPYLDAWWKASEFDRPNLNVKLNSYYARKNIHVQKLAMAIHFADSGELRIPLDTVKQAIKVLDAEEVNMHHCLGFQKQNPLSSATKRIKDFFKHHRSKRFTEKELIAEFFDDLPGPDFRESLKVILEHLKEAGVIRQETVMNEQLKMLLPHWKWKEV